MIGIRRKQTQVRQIVIADITVDMIHHFRWQQEAAKLLLHYQPMHRDVPTVP